jgi:hypothetical protein
MDSADLTPEEREAVAEASGDASAAPRQLSARDRSWSDTGRVKYPSRSDDEVVVERRPIVEEVVVRRRLVDEGEAAASAEPVRRIEEGDRPS